MYRRTTAVCIAVVMAMTVTSCHGGASSASGTAATTTPDSSATPGVTAGRSALRRSTVCDDLPVAQVAAMTGLPLTFSISVPTTKPVDLVECLYADAAKSVDRVHQVSVDVAYGGGAATLHTLTAQVTFDQATLGPVAGLGDAAQASDDGLAVQYGPDVIAVVDSFEDTLLTRSALIKIVQALHDRLS